MAWLRKNRGYWATIDGQQIFLSHDKREAGIKERQLRKAPKVPFSRKTVQQLASDYDAWLEAYKAESTHASASPSLKSFATFLPYQLAEETTPAQVEEWLKTTQCKKPGSINRRITLLCSMFNWGVKTRRITTNPIKGMPRPTSGVREVVLPADRYQELMKQVDTCPPMRDFLVFMLDTGARVEEMFKLRAEHFNLDKRVAVIPRSKSKGRHRTGGTARVIHLPQAAFEIAERLIEQYSHGHMFRNSIGAPYNKNSINNYMRRLSKRMGIPGLCATVMRHSFAAHRIRSGQDLATVGKLMGHKDASMVYKIYGHLDDDAYLAGQASAVSLPLTDALAKAGP